MFARPKDNATIALNHDTMYVNHQDCDNAIRSVKPNTMTSDTIDSAEYF